MDVFRLRNELIEDYSSYIKSFIGLKKNELKAFSEYRIRRLILEAWDAIPHGAAPCPMPGA